mmetsp:Transcript_83295/g.217543  ORF Transcript_83295/g.217543 Transcript_83295/m.217543 type:complete len:402 (-) Transcript_83295:5-1210(-)
MHYIACLACTNKQRPTVQQVTPRLIGAITSALRRKLTNPTESSSTTGLAIVRRTASHVPCSSRVLVHLQIRQASVPVVPGVVVPVPEVHEDRHGHDEDLVVWVAHPPKVDGVVVHIGREHPHERAGYPLLDVAHGPAALRVGDVEVHTRARAARARAPQAQLAAAAVRRQHGPAALVPDGEVGAEASARVANGPQDPAAGGVVHTGGGAVEAAARARGGALHVERLLRCPPPSVEYVQIPGRAIPEALLELPLHEARLLHREEHLLVGGAVDDSVPVGHLDLLPQQRRAGLDRVHLLLDLDARDAPHGLHRGRGGQPLRAPRGPPAGVLRGHPALRRAELLLGNHAVAVKVHGGEGAHGGVTATVDGTVAGRAARHGGGRGPARRARTARPLAWRGPAKKP